MRNELRIKEILKERGISVAEFAERLGIERQNVYNVFSKPTWRRLEQCSQILNIPIVDLFKKSTSEINGYIDFQGTIYRINNMHSFGKLLDIINNNIEVKDELIS